MKFLIFVLLASCQTVGQTPSLMSANPPEYKKTMAMKVNGKPGFGVMTAPLAKSYQIDMTFPAKPEILKISTCHKNIIYEKPAIASVLIKMTDGLETGYCPIRIDALDLGGINSSAIIEIENEELPAVLFCDGQRVETHGVSICQAKVGLVQRILFDEVTTFEKLSPDCADLKDTGREAGHVYDFNPTRGDCVYIFHSSKTDTFHRLSVLGYTDTFFSTIGVKAQ